MSDRLAVFNRGRIEQVGTPGRGLRASRARTFVAGFVGTSNLLTRRGGAGDHRRGRAPSPSGRRRSASPTADEAPGADEVSALGHDPRGRLPRPGHALHRRARRGRRAGRHPAEPATTSIDGGARRQQGQAGPAASGSGEHVLSPSRSEDPQAATRRRGDRSDRMRQPCASPALAGRDRPCVVAACSGGAAADAGRPAPHDAIGAGEGELNLVIWDGYAERGAADPAYDWVTPFEEKTGCKVNTTDMTDSNNGVSLMQSGEYDGISASGDATTRLIAGGLVAPVDTSCSRTTRTSSTASRTSRTTPSTASTTACRTAAARTCSMWNTDVVTTAPTSWDPIWEGGADYAGQDQHLRLVDLHRRRGAAPDDRRSPTWASRTRTSSTRRSSTRRSSCSSSSNANDATVLGHCGRPGRVVRVRRRRRRHDLAVPGRTCCRADKPAGRRRPARRGLDRLVRHLDDRTPRRKHPNCMLHVDGPHDVGRGQRPGDGLVRRGADQPRRRATTAETISPGHCEHDARDRRGVLRQDLVLDHAAGGLRRRRRGDDLQGPRTTGSRPGPRCAAADAGPTPSADIEGSPGHRPGEPSRYRMRLDGSMTHADARPRRLPPAAPAAVRRVAALAPRAAARCSCGCCSPAPLAWMVIVYLGSLVRPAAQRVLGQGRFTGKVEPFNWTLDAFQDDRQQPGLRDHRAADGRRWPSLVTITDALLAFPIAYYMARDRLAAQARRCWSSRCSCRSGRRTSSRSTRGASSSRATASLDWVLAPFGIDGAGPRTDLPTRGSCSATCGCRT